LYVFGGKDEENNKLKDFWRLDLGQGVWSEIISNDNSEPLERSGHSCDVYGNYMILFGGIYEITKELNDFYMFDFKKNVWLTLFEESVSPKKVMN
jgi:N-acetylneuraminic acid mutarotase